MTTDKTTLQNRWLPALVVRLLLWVFITLLWSIQVQHFFWFVAFPMFSSLVLIWLGAQLEFGSCKWSRRLMPNAIAITLLACALLNHSSLRPGLLTMSSWVAFRACVMIETLLTRRSQSVKTLCIDLARIFPPLGIAWLTAFELIWTPWDIAPFIATLTSLHFYQAGFTLPLMAELNARERPGCWTWLSCVAVLAGVPLFAAGVTCTHFGVLRFLEPFGVVVLAFGAMGVALSQIQRGIEKERRMLVRAGFVASGVSLLAALLLAVGFGLRHVFPNLALTFIPQGWIISGTLNAFGFGLCGILAWRGRSLR